MPARRVHGLVGDVLLIDQYAAWSAFTRPTIM